MDDQLTGNAGHVQPPDSPPDAEVALPTNSAQPFAPVAVAEGLGKYLCASAWEKWRAVPVPDTDTPAVRFPLVLNVSSRTPELT